MYSITRNDVKKIAQQIESLAKDVQSKIENDDGFLLTANELVAANSTFTFSLGELYATEHSSSKKVSAKIVKAGNPNYYNIRDPQGRFTKKV